MKHKGQSLFTELGNYLKAKRLAAKLSQSDASRALGYSGPQFISNFERGLCAPPIGKLKILIDLYNISPKELTYLLMKEQRKYIDFHLSKAKGLRKKA